MNNPHLILKIVKYLELDDIYNLSFTNKENYELLKDYGHIYSYIINVRSGGSSYDYGFNEKFFENKVAYMIKFMKHIGLKYYIKICCTRIRTLNYRSLKSQYDPIDIVYIKNKLVLKSEIMHFPVITDQLYYECNGCYKNYSSDQLSNFNFWREKHIIDFT